MTSKSIVNLADRATLSALVYDMTNEYKGAMAKFPGNRCNLAALMEEVGELAQAMLKREFEPSAGVSRADIYAEAVQVGAMAMKIALHGSSEYTTYAYEPSCHLDFKPTGTK